MSRRSRALCPPWQLLYTTPMSSAAEKAYEAIRDGIVGGDLPVGGRLREEELAGSIGVSRTPVREALRRLDAEGLVEFSPHRGAQVAPAPSSAPPWPPA